MCFTVLACFFHMILLWYHNEHYDVLFCFVFVQTCLLLYSCILCRMPRTRTTAAVQHSDRQVLHVRLHVHTAAGIAERCRKTDPWPGWATAAVVVTLCLDEIAPKNSRLDYRYKFKIARCVDCCTIRWLATCHVPGPPAAVQNNGRQALCVQLHVHATAVGIAAQRHAVPCGAALLLCFSIRLKIA